MIEFFTRLSLALFCVAGLFYFFSGKENIGFLVTDWYMYFGNRTLHLYFYRSGSFPMGEAMSLHEGVDIG